MTLASLLDALQQVRDALQRANGPDAWGPALDAIRMPGSRQTLFEFVDGNIVELEAALAPQENPCELDDDRPLALVSGQICDLLEGVGAPEDHADVIMFLLGTGLPRGTVDRVHRAIVSAEVTP